MPVGYKYVIITIRRNPRRNGPRMKYPAIFDAQEAEENIIGPHVRDRGLARGEDTEECMICLKDRIANKYDADPDCRIVTEVDADAWLATCPSIQDAPGEEYDQLPLLAALVRKFVTGASTQDDLNALNADHPALGIRKKKTTAADIFVER